MWHQPSQCFATTLRSQLLQSVLDTDEPVSRMRQWHSSKDTTILVKQNVDCFLKYTLQCYKIINITLSILCVPTKRIILTLTYRIYAISVVLCYTSFFQSIYYIMYICLRLSRNKIFSILLLNLHLTSEKI